MTSVRIYQPSKTVMQSGKRKTNKWLIEFETQKDKFIEPLMGWTASSNTRGQLRLFFPTLEEALHFVQSKGFSYKIINPSRIVQKPKNYGTNFTCSRVRGV